MEEEKKYKNKYRIKSIRLQYWNYANNEYYFITICTKNRECYFGNIINGKIKLSNIGKLAKDELLETEKIRPNIKLDEWIIMPNHIHAIIVIENNNTADVETRRGASLQYQRRKFGPLQKNSLSSIINLYKGAVTKRCTKNNIDFIWQPRFYDHIIRDEKSLTKIRQYIVNNPLRWELDRNNPENLLM